MESTVPPLAQRFRIGRGTVLEGKIPGACFPRGLDYAGGGLEVKSLKSNPTAAHGAGAMKFQSLAQGPVASVKPIALAGAATCSDLERVAPEDARWTTGSFTFGSCWSIFNCS